MSRGLLPAFARSVLPGTIRAASPASFRGDSAYYKHRMGYYSGDPDDASLRATADSAAASLEGRSQPERATCRRNSPLTLLAVADHVRGRIDEPSDSPATRRRVRFKGGGRTGRCVWRPRVHSGRRYEEAASICWSGALRYGSSRRVTRLDRCYAPIRGKPRFERLPPAARHDRHPIGSRRSRRATTIERELGRGGMATVSSPRPEARAAGRDQVLPPSSPPPSAGSTFRGKSAQRTAPPPTNTRCRFR